MDDMEIFDVFAEGNSSASPGNVDESEATSSRLIKKSEMGKKKQKESRERANQLLGQLSLGFTSDKDATTLSIDNDGEADDCDEEVLPKRSKIETITEELHGLASHPRNNIKVVETEGNCSHEIVLPPNMEYVPLKPRTTVPAKMYEFQLDSFQREAITCIDNSHSVLVSAHTSAGKTVVALYAIAMSLRDKQRVIYTSPIKALSNQKYRELEEEFGASLMTGDNTLNPDASCIVMTTEILRSMLYRGSEIMREVGWVVFDEIHYMRDKERGVVWEETIILLPDTVHYVFLSATIPNARQFADWVVYLHEQPVHVIYTDYRPVPLQHFIYPAGGSGLYEVVNMQDKFTEAMNVLSEVGDAGQGGINRGKKGGTTGVPHVVNIVRTLKERDMIPVIIFSFSRKECEAYATQMTNLDFNTEDEKAKVKEIFVNAISLLSEEDSKLPEIGRVLPLLMRGIGVHHSGLLPIVKEVIEILFGEGLIKTLFATETFSMGLNMPARTVLFTSARKFDGKDYRWITSGEYIQMSGRAGRRGKDDRGLVILMVDQQMGQDVAKQIIKGAPDPLNSQFRLTYNMVLNLLRVEGINPEFMLENSFYQFQNYDALPQLYESLLCGKKKKELAACKINRETEISGYYQMEKQIGVLKEAVREIVMKPQTSCTLSTSWTFASYVLMLLSAESAKNLSDITQLRPPDANDKGVVEVVSVAISCVSEISAVRVKLPQNLKAYEGKQSAGRVIKEVLKRFNGIMPLLDPLNDMKINDAVLQENIIKLQALEKRKDNHPLRENSKFNEIYKQYEKKLELEAELKVAKTELKKAQSLLQLDELKCRKRVLRRLQYCDENDVITQKGRVSCEVSAADELMLTEMMFGGIFSELATPQLAALLSCFVFEEKAGGTKLADDLSGCLRTMQEYARRIAKVTKESKLEIDEDKYVESFKPHLMDVVHAWCTGSSFAEILKKTDVFEGSIIRCMRRLEELLREMVGASKAIGNGDLEARFEEARILLKRDIVFTASLYL
ncbi:Superkiller viralicidic activity 2-like 2 [Dirofilaria immitis]|nr:Superkiller viralicidic activity 2-like 2 [Dirofilaria immitis]